MAGILSLAPDDNTLTTSPTWERIDLNYAVKSFTIDRGRENETARTGTGVATVELVDLAGDFDPTNTSGAFYGRLTTGEPMGPLVQAKIELQNPVTAVWWTMFRGFISRINWVPYQDEQHANVTLELVDALALLAAAEMPVDGSFGDDFLDGSIVFDEDATLDAVETRLNNVLDQFGWSATLRKFATGNVGLQQTKYAPRTTVLQVIHDACDAEFPDIANFYVGKRSAGYLVFHGRFYRFHPADVQYDLEFWDVGDDTAAFADPTNIVRISPPLVASLDDTTLYNSAYATPNDPTGLLTDADFAANYVTDTVSAGKIGLRTWSAENLLTLGGLGTTGLEETKLMADYVRDNYFRPRVRVGQVTIKSRDHTSVFGPATWQLLTEIDISDVVHLTTTHNGGGGFDQDFYVEGLHYTARKGGGVPYVELTLDLSPRGYYDANPFEGT